MAFELLKTISWWFPPLILLNAILASCFLAAQYWYVRNKRFMRASIGAFGINGGRGVGSIVCAATLPGPIALPVGDIVGRVVGIVALDRKAVTLRAFGQFSVYQPKRGRWHSATGSRHFSDAILGVRGHFVLASRRAFHDAFTALSLPATWHSRSVCCPPRWHWSAAASRMSIRCASLVTAKRSPTAWSE